MRKRKQWKRELAVLLTAALALGGVNVTASAAETSEAELALEHAVIEIPDGYSGTPITPQLTGDVYQITSAEEMYGFAKLVNEGATTANAVLTNDMNLEGDVEWTPIGSAEKVYTGTFDGQGHRIYNLKILGDDSNVGLFGFLDAGAQIRNVIIDSTCFIQGTDHVAAIAGACKGSAETEIVIENCGNEGEVNAKGANAAAMVGCLGVGVKGLEKDAKLTIKNCYNTGAITGYKESAAFGGWLGANTKLINCYNTGTISGVANRMSFARYNSISRSTFENCYQQDNIDSIVEDGLTIIKMGDVLDGKLCYLLNGDQSDIQWYQTLNATTTYMVNQNPVLFDAYKVYELADASYANSQHEVALSTLFTYTAPSDLKYNKTAKTANVAWTDSTEAVTGGSEITGVTYKKDNAGELLDEATEAGTYQVYAVITEGKIYDPAEVEVGSFTISYNEVPETILYNGAAKAETYEVGTNVVVSADEYTLSESLTGEFSDSITFTSETADTVKKTLYFKDRNGYYSAGAEVSVSFKAKEVPPSPTPNPGDQNPGQAGNQNPGQTGDQNPGQTGDQNPGQTGDQNPGQTGDQNPGQTGDQTGTEKELPKKGTTIKVGKAYYKVTTSSETKGTVTYVKPTNKKQKSITIPDTVEIDGYTFRVTEIAANACKSNSKLTTVTIGKNVKTIGKNAFAGCKKLFKITIKTTKLTTKTVGKNAFKGIRAKATIKVPKTKVKAYTKLLRSKGVSKLSKINK